MILPCGFVFHGLTLWEKGFLWSQTNSNSYLGSCFLLNVTHHSWWYVGLMLCKEATKSSLYLIISYQTFLFDLLRGAHQLLWVLSSNSGVLQLECFVLILI